MLSSGNKSGSPDTATARFRRWSSKRYGTGRSYDPVTRFQNSSNNYAEGADLQHRYHRDVVGYRFVLREYTTAVDELLRPFYEWVWESYGSTRPDVPLL